MPAIIRGQDDGGDDTWTLMVYMSGDSSLSGQIPSDLQEMKKVGSVDGLSVIVLHDSAEIGDTGLTYILPNGMENIPLTDINPVWGNELNLGNPETLIQFVKWAADEYPADRYMLDLWGHGNGWPGVCPDKGDPLGMAELGEAMDSIGGSDVMIDIISMDACQMGMLEVAYELRGKAGYAILSQKDVPLNGWPYDVFLEHLKTGGSPEEVGRKMIDSYIAWGMGGNSLYSLTLSLIDLGELDDLAQALEDYAREAVLTVGFFNPEIIAARAQTEEYDGNAQYDLIDLLDNIDNRTECKALAFQSAGVRLAMEACVVHENHWTNLLDEPAENAHGLSVWFPEYAPSTGYLMTGFGKDNAWTDFISQMAGYFQNPGREDSPLPAEVFPLDSDDDGLLDSISIIHHGQDTGFMTEAEIHGPDGSLDRQTFGPGTERTSDVPLANLGFYEVALYQRSSDGILLNYTLAKGLVKEGLSIISGRVTSNAGRGLAWVELSLADGNGNVITSVFTDNFGYYDMKVVVPSDTEGSGLQLFCGLGSGRQNVTIAALEEQIYIDFTVEISSAYIPWAVRAIGILNLAGIMALVYWVAWGREKKLGRRKTENVLDGPPIPPQ